MARRVLVTGGGGFIGSNLVGALLERGDDVRVLDNFSTGNRRNLADVWDDVELVEGDLRSYERVHAATRGVELVFHQGALPSVPRSVQDPLTTSAVNVEGTLNVLLAARDEGIRRVVAASSSSVYGNTGTLPRVESSPPDPVSPYAVAKLAAERYCVSFSRVYDLETVVLRYFNVFGPRQDPTSEYAAVVPRASPSRWTATASSRATSRSWTTSSPAISSPRTRATPAGPCSTSRPENGRRSTSSWTCSASSWHARSSVRRARPARATCAIRGLTSTRRED
jgi:nucleoside-diphosphate-sugar epimerase